MLGFGKKKPFTPEEFREAVADVRRRMTDGDYVSGAQAASALRHSVENRNGARNVMWGEAHFLEARVAMMIGDLATGLEHMRAAVDIEGDDEASVEARLTHAMNLGDVLAEMGEFEEAEQVLRDSLEERRALYGEAHPLFGYGAESLTALLLSQGRFDEAAEYGRAAALAFGDGEAAKRESSMVLWLTAEKARDPRKPALEKIPAEDVADLLPAIADAHGHRVIDALVDLRWEMYDRLEGRDHKMSCLAQIALEARVLERHDDRIRALRDYVKLVASDSADEAAHALQGLALAYEEAGRHEEALVTYEEARVLAKTD